MNDTGMVTKESPVQQAVNRCSAVAHEIAELINRAENDLDLILLKSEVVTDDESNTSIPRPCPSSPLVREIDNITELLNIKACHLRNIIDRIEV